MRARKSIVKSRIGAQQEISHILWLAFLKQAKKHFNDEPKNPTDKEKTEAIKERNPSITRFGGDVRDAKPAFDHPSFKQVLHWKRPFMEEIDFKRGATAILKEIIPFDRKVLGDIERR